MISIGDKFCLGSECFYVTKNADEKIEATAEYSLYVGRIILKESLTMMLTWRYVVTQAVVRIAFIILAKKNFILAGLLLMEESKRGMVLLAVADWIEPTDDGYDWQNEVAKGVTGAKGDASCGDVGCYIGAELLRSCFTP